MEDSLADSTALSVTLYLRGGAGGTVARRQAAVRERFDAIRADGRLGEGRVRRWAQSVVTPVADDESDDAAAVAVYRELEAAIDAGDGRLEPFFERREREGGLLVGGADGYRITFPVCCLVVRREERITGLYPCWLDGTHHSVEDGLAALEAGDPENLR